MAKTIVYGIKNCETMKKALAWLDKRKAGYVFHDYKKEGAPEDVIKAAIEAHGWENVINRKGTSWRKLPEKTRAGMTEKTALQAALENPSLIRRPLVAHGNKFLLGFDEAEFKKLF